jgi:hypothetical protein
MYRNMLKILFLTALILAVCPGVQAGTLNPGDKLVIPFTVNPALFQGTPDWLDGLLFGVGVNPSILASDIAVSIYDGALLEGVYHPSDEAFSQHDGSGGYLPVSLFGSLQFAAFRASDAVSTGYDPTIIDFLWIRGGTSNGRIEIAAPTTTLTYSQIYPGDLWLSYNSSGIQTETPGLLMGTPFVTVDGPQTPGEAPEPATFALCGTLLAGFLALRRARPSLRSRQ